MSQEERKDPSELGEIDRSPEASVTTLAELAQHAYAQKRWQDCLDLTKAILLLDPENIRAIEIRSSAYTELRKDFAENARALLNSRRTQSPEERLDAGTLFVRQQIANQERRARLREPDPPPSAFEELQTRMTSLLADSKQVIKASALKKQWFAYVSGVIILGLVAVGWARSRNVPHVVDASKPQASQTANSFKPNTNLEPEKPVPQATRPVSGTISTVPAAPPELDQRSVTIGNVRPSTPDRPASIVPPAPRGTDKTVVAAANGILAVSSNTTVDIYKDDAFLGSVPASLQLPAGSHTIEYRHGSLRKRVTHVIQGNETTRAAISFDVSLQINSNPWADVYLDGTERKALGQTPLSDVRVPVGSVLILENPKFQAKRYRVTGNETRIQIVFP